MSVIQTRNKKEYEGRVDKRSAASTLRLTTPTGLVPVYRKCSTGGLLFSTPLIPLFRPQLVACSSAVPPVSGANYGIQ